MTEGEAQLPLPLVYAQAVGEYRAGRLEGAEGLCRQVLATNDRHAEALHLLGVIRHRRGETAEGIACIERAIGLAPQASYYCNLAKIWQTLGQLPRAEELARRAADLAPQSAPVLTALGSILCQQARCDEAAMVLERALAIAPDNTEALGTLAGAYVDLGLVNQSQAVFARASALSPEPVFRILGVTRLPIVYESSDDVRQWRQRLDSQIDGLLAEGVVQDLTARAATPLFTLAHQGMNDVEILRKYGRLYRGEDQGQGTGDRRQGKEGRGERHGRIRVGFISSFFRDHTIGKLFCGLIARLSRADFEVTV